MKNIAVAFVIIVIILGIGIALLSPVFSTVLFNKISFVVHKADDATNYRTLKKVEDTCRAMISSYEADRLTYEQYKHSDNEDKVEWAEQAKMRANKTASTYNNYILENSFLWKGGIPSDIRSQLDYIN